MDISDTASDQYATDFFNFMTKNFIPFSLFITAAIGLSFCGAVNIDLLIGIGITAIILGALLAHNNPTYWKTIFEFLGSRTAMTATLLWLMVGVYGNILKEGHMVEGLVWATDSLNMGGAGFTLVTFLFSGLFAISTGSGFGTISAMSLTLFPAGIAIGAHPALLGGAILSGAALGDSIAPVSDTAIIAATTQEFQDGGHVADVGGTVRHRLPIVLVSIGIAIVVFLVAGVFLSESAVISRASTKDDYKGLALLLPTFVVMALAFRKVNIFVSLFVGIVTAIAIGLGLHLFSFSTLVNVENSKVGGAIVEGIGGMTSICLLLMVVVSLTGLILRSGGMERIISKLNVGVGHSQRKAELVIFTMVAWAGILIAAVNTIANICIAPFVNSMGKQHGIHPYRRATILATVICTFPFVLPYGGCLLLLLKGIEASGANVALQATDMFFTAFYPWALLVCSLITCFIKHKQK